MIITHELLKPYEIWVDSDQYTLVKIGAISSGPSIGKRTESTIGYFTNLDNCLRKIVKEQLIEGNEVIGLDEYVSQTCQKLKELHSLEILNQEVVGGVARRNPL